jgi:hypothetical protein
LVFPKLLSVAVPDPYHVAFNATNTLLAVGSRDGDAGVILDLADGREVARAEGIHLRDLEAFEFFGDKLLAIRDRACVFYDVRRGKFETVFAADGIYPQSATIDPPGRLLAVGVKRGLILYDLEKRAVGRRLETSVAGAPLFPAFSPGGRFVAADFITEAYGDFLVVWDTADGKRWRTLEIVSQGDPVVAFRGDTPALVLGQNGLNLYEPGQGDEPVAHYPRPMYPQALAFLDGNRTLAAVGGSKEGLVVLSAATGRVKRAIDRPEGREVGASFPSPDWSLIASATEGGVLVWSSGLAAKVGGSPRERRTRKGSEGSKRGRA